MLRNFLRAKIHSATVTEANLHYVGSLTIDEDLMDAAGIAEFEAVHIANVTNGERLTTYAIRGPRSSGAICANGAAAHKINVGDTIIIFAYAMLTEAEVATHQPNLVFVDKRNRIAEQKQIEAHQEIFEPAF